MESPSLGVLLRSVEIARGIDGLMNDFSLTPVMNSRVSANEGRVRA